MGRKEDNIKKAASLMTQLDHVRCIDIAAHIDHGKTTLTDNLVAGAGMISEELAGKQLFMDYDEEEQQRGITINAAVASMVHEFDGENYLINLIDTPGHVDFGGDVTRAMRAVDGCIIVVDSVEGPMPQTETVVRQALREKVKPVLFINKVDRLVNELRLTPEAMQQRFVKIIGDVNRLLQKMLPPDLQGKWVVKVEDGSVAFGSAYHNWALTAPFMKKSGVTFKEIIELAQKGEMKAVAKKAPLAKVLLNMVIRHLPSPTDAQKYRIPHIWKGEDASPAGQAMIHVKSDGPLCFMVTKIIVDPQAGEIAIGRLFSGTLERGQDLTVIGQPGTNRIQNVGMMVGADRIVTERVTAGNIAAVSGLRTAIAGSTVTNDPALEPFERIVHYTEPVVTKAIEAKHTRDLPKLVEVLRLVSKADPSVEVQINNETGEHLIAGMGELHLEVIEHRIVRDYKLEISTSPPIVVYRENVKGRSPGKFEGKSPNKHNRFYVEVEPLPANVVKAIHDGDIPSDARKHAKEVETKMRELGMDRDEAKGIFHIVGTSLFTDVTKGIQNLHETKELVKEAFEEVCKRGPLSGEPLLGMKARLVDAKLHEDAVHRGPAQTIPAVRNAVYGAMTVATGVLLEPMQKVVVQVPQDLMGDVTREMQQRRGVILDIQQEGDLSVIITKAPVAEMFGFAGAIRSATGGRCLWSTENMGFEPVPAQLQEKIVRQIRERKGLKPEPYDAAYYAG